MISEQCVVVFSEVSTNYPKNPPFHPDALYPEYQWNETSREKNHVYEAVRKCFFLAKLDIENYNTKNWNPLGKFIKPGNTVLIKPNLIKESHPRYENGWLYTLTHGSIIRCIADYVLLALKGSGKIIVGDSPQTDSSFEKICDITGLYEIQRFYATKAVDFELMDLRMEQWTNKGGVIVERKQLVGDPLGYVVFDLANSSEFSGHQGSGRYYGADYDTDEVNRHHQDGHHEYLISGTAIECDVIFNLPKLKTHKKAGITVSLKNLVGINGDKNWLPHHTEGCPADGGDEHPNPNLKHRLERKILTLFRRLATRMPTVGPLWLRHARKVGIKVFGDTEMVIRSGNWWGNDTVWRMCLDLNKIVAYGEKDGTLRQGKPENRKRHLIMVDGITAGQGNGPMNCDPFFAGILIFGINPVSVDATCAHLMGYDPLKIPIVKNAFHCRDYSLAEWSWKDIQVICNRQEWCGFLSDIPYNVTYRFEPHFGWRGHVERVK